MNDTLAGCGRDGKKIVKYCQKCGAVIECGKGDHMKVCTARGVVPVPVAHELGKGLLHAICKELMHIGIPATQEKKRI
jgi:predicted RNA binding protein YcfA (HicA-like mRNA interferase family)